jgi:predicted transcriptional regulator of viral defense system
MNSIDQRTVGSLDRMLERQAQLITRRQLNACGIDDFTITRRIRRGYWQRILPGIYLMTAGPLSTEQRRIAAGLYVGSNAQLTGLSALHWHGFRYAPATDRVHVLVAHKTRRRSTSFVMVQRTHELDPRAHETEHYSVTSAARAAVDACRATPDLRTVRAIMSEAVQSRFASLHQLEREVARAGRSRTAVARRVVGELMAGVRSSPEAELREIALSSAVLPTVLWNPRLTTSDGDALPTPDGWIPNAGIAVEVDSREHHSSADDWARTLSRHNRLTQYGALVLHFTPREIRDEPGRVLRVIEQAYINRMASSPTHAITAGAPL